ncbi:hypothetical protein HGB07_03520, partial [Candidatus Roizmanbacteria bacterium]|nr:hypothetical protein [Candidatus Roizmanbacteria bacterium]
MKKIIASLKNPVILRSVLGAIVIVGVIAVSLFYFKTENRVFIDDSLVSAPITSIGPTTPGKLKSISAVAGQAVKKGDAL